MPIGSLLAGLAPIAGSFGSAALQQSYAQKNWDRVNAYNHPKEQIKRLKEAGLPLATMFGGQGGSTSSSIDTPNVDPSLGVAEGLSKSALFTMQKKQLELLENQIYTEQGRGKKEWGEALRVKTENDRTMNQVYGYDLQEPGKENDYSGIYGAETNQVENLKRAQRQAQANVEATNLVNDLHRITNTLRGEQLQAEVDRILVDIKAREGYAELRDQVIKDLTQGGSGWKGIQRLIAAFLLKNQL